MSLSVLDSNLEMRIETLSEDEPRHMVRPALSPIVKPHAGRWLDLWTTSLYPVRVPSDTTNTVADHTLFHDNTIRQTVRLSLALSAVRIAISNQYGESVLSISSATVARPARYKTFLSAGSPAIQPETCRGLSFSGSDSVDVAPGATIYSDPVLGDLPAASDLSISLYLANRQFGELISAHQMAKSTGWITRGLGDRTADTILHGEQTTWTMYLSIVSGFVTGSPSWSLACFGDSLTDCGDGKLPLNTNSLWPDLLQARLSAKSPCVISVRVGSNMK
jgi:hypothetical protein